MFLCNAITQQLIKEKISKLQDRYEVERSWDIKRYKNKLKRKERRDRIVFINTQSFSNIMEDNNAPLH